MGFWAAANFLALPIGPILGGWLLTHHWWGWVFLINVPVVLVGAVAVAALVPESRAPARPSFDIAGIATSVAGLVALTYGLIEAGRHGWGSPSSLVAIGAGLALLCGFLAWERTLARRTGGEPLIDLGLFRSRAYAWGVILQALAVVSMIGVLFTMPQYFQAVLGTNAMGSGLRLLPLIGGLVAGAVPADRAARIAGARLTTAAGFALLAAGLLLGSQTGVGSSDGFIAAWMAIVGAGMGLAMATAASTALAELSPERSGVGSAVLQAVNKVGGPFGTAILGSVASSAYLARLDLTGITAPAAAAARQSVFAGLDQALVVAAGFALAGALLAVLYLPRAAAAAEAGRDRGTGEGHVVHTG